MPSTTFVAALAAILVFAWFCRSGATTPNYRSAWLAHEFHHHEIDIAVRAV